MKTETEQYLIDKYTGVRGGTDIGYSVFFRVNQQSFNIGYADNKGEVEWLQTALAKALETLLRENAALIAALNKEVQ